jgi:hypothetical protein
MTQPPCQEQVIFLLPSNPAAQSQNCHRSSRKRLSVVWPGFPSVRLVSVGHVSSLNSIVELGSIPMLVCQEGAKSASDEHLYFLAGCNA